MKPRNFEETYFRLRSLKKPISDSEVISLQIKTEILNLKAELNENLYFCLDKLPVFVKDSENSPDCLAFEVNRKYAFYACSQISFGESPLAHDLQGCVSPTSTWYGLQEAQLSPLCMSIIVSFRKFSSFLQSCISSFCKEAGRMGNH